MADWAKIKFFHNTLLGRVGSTLVATSTESTGDFDVDYLHNWLETNFWQAEDSGLTDPQYITLDMGANLGAELLSNAGFETGTWGDWVKDKVDGIVEFESTLVNSGTKAARLFQGISLGTNLSQTISVTSGDVLELSLYSAGDGTNAGRYKIYDVTNSTDIVSVTSTGITGNSYSRVEKVFVVPSGCTSLRLYLYPAGVNEAVAYFDDVSLKVDTPASTSVADYMAIIGHNLNTTEATITLQYSADNFSTDINDVFSEALSVDTAYLKEFTSPGAKRFWRLKIAGHGLVPPFISLCVWGLKTELDYATASFDPNAQSVKANVNISQGGVVTGLHEKYTERSLALRFTDAESDICTKVKSWWEDHGIKNLFVAWETANHPTEIYLLRPDLSFNNPLTNGGLYRDISINLTGRKE
ncbi:MAG: hypothetical protein KAT46_03040 [Deltaproteobacteria bacterium]|nr:hypothetical protein [Deltaproteobacteria bacterium]